MLWYRAWLETRVKCLLTLGVMALYLVLFYLGRRTAPPPSAKTAASFAFTLAAFVVVIYTWLAGAGIVTQAAFQQAKGLHDSTLFTLSLPVSRFRLLAIRSGIGWLESAGFMAAYCYAMWLIVPVVRASVPARDMFECVVALVACASALYFLSVLLATFLDDQWRMWGGMIAFGALWLFSNWLPDQVNIVRAMLGSGSPLLAHTMPWSTMAFSMGLACVFFVAALKVVRAREY